MNKNIEKKEFKKKAKKYLSQKPIKTKIKNEKLPRDIILELSDVKKIIPMDNYFLEIIKGVDLKIYKKDFIILFGESGSGKTTLLGLMAALERPSEGKVNILGYLTATLNDSQMTKIRSKYIGYIFQQYGLLDAVSALDNTMITTPSKYKYQAIKNLNSLGLKDHIHKKVSNLSGGQQQRVSIARALSKNPQILFCDEPTGAVDSKTAKDIISIFKKINDNGIAIIMVTHNHNLEKIGNRIIELEDGRIKRDVKNIPMNIDDIIWN
ncbi:MAG: ABC transporter ATP-binding protein [Mycoplasmoidaceae bacterium]